MAEKDPPIQGLRNREILIQRIDSESVRRIAREIYYLSVLGDDPIRVFIASSGGEVAPGMELYDLLQKRRAKGPWIHGIVIDVASSMAAVALQGCHYRVMYPGARIGLHRMAGNIFLGEKSYQYQTLANGLFNRQAINDKLDELEAGAGQLTDRIVQICADRTGLSKNKVMRLCNEEVDMSADQALELGFVDHVV